MHSPERTMMMKPSKENASSPQDEMAVPNAIMLTAMVTCRVCVVSRAHAKACSS